MLSQRISLRPAAPHLAAHTEAERLSPLESARWPSRSKQRVVQEGHKAAASEPDSPQRSLPSLTHPSAPVSRGPLATGYRASRYQRPAAQQEAVAAAGVLREVQRVRDVSPPQALATPLLQPQQLRGQGVSGSSQDLPTAKHAVEERRHGSQSTIAAPRPAVGQPLSPVQSGDEDTHSASSVRRSDNSSESFGSPDTSQADAASITRDSAAEQRHPGGGVPSSHPLRLATQGVQTTSSSLRASVVAAANAPPKQSATDRRVPSLFNPEASVFVSQFVGDASQTSPTRNSTWCAAADCPDFASHHKFSVSG